MLPIIKCAVDMLLAVAHVFNPARGRDLATAVLYLILGAVGFVEVLPL